MKKTTIYIEDELLKKIKVLAIELDTSMNDLVIKALEEKYSDK